MKKFLLSTTAALVFATTTLHAQSTYVDQTVAALEDQNYDSIEIKTGPTQIKLEAIRGGMKLEAIYDASTGVILKQEVGPVEAGDDFVQGVTYRTEDEDFLDDVLPSVIDRLASDSSFIADTIAALQAENYTSIEVKSGPTQIKVEAIRDGMKLEIVYDAATGTELKREIEPLEAGEDIHIGVSYDVDDEDFVGRSRDDDDDSDDDNDDDRDDDDDHDDDRDDDDDSDDDDRDDDDDDDRDED